MSQDKRHIDQLFKEGLQGVGEKPPFHSWDRLNRDLDRTYYNKPIVYFRWVAAVALILIAFGAGYYIATLNIKQELKIAHTDTTNPEIESLDFEQEAISRNIEKSNIANDIDVENLNPASSNIENSIAELNNNNSISQSENISIQPTHISNNNEIIARHDIVQREDNLSRMVWNPFEKIEISNFSQENKEGLDKDNKKEESALSTTYASSGVELINPLNVYQYDDPVKKKNDQIWVVGAQFAPVISYRDISNTYGSQNNGSTDQKSDLNNMEESLLSYAGGVDVNFNLNKRWSIQSGAYYSRIGQVNSDALNFKQENNDYLLFSINTSTGNINIAFEKVPDDVRKISPPKDTINAIDVGDVKVVQNFDLFEIPLMLKYKILHKKLSISFAGGLSPAYLLGNSTYLEVENTKYNIGTSPNLNSMIINSSFSLGFDIALSKKFSFNLEPTFKYSLNPLNKDSQFDYHPYSLSWFTGVKYKF